jgi:hypothetical protein
MFPATFAIFRLSLNLLHVAPATATTFTKVRRARHDRHCILPRPPKSQKLKTWSRESSLPLPRSCPVYSIHIPQNAANRPPMHWSLWLDLTIRGCIIMAPHATGKTPIKIPGKRTRGTAKEDVATRKKLVRPYLLSTIHWLSGITVNILVSRRIVLLGAL